MQVRTNSRALLHPVRSAAVRALFVDLRGVPNRLETQLGRRRAARAGGRAGEGFQVGANVRFVVVNQPDGRAVGFGAVGGVGEVLHEGIVGFGGAIVGHTGFGFEGY